MPKTKRYLLVFTERLELLIDNSDVTLIELAKKLGVHKNTIYSWRDGSSMPDAKGVADLAEIFGVSADWLLGLVDE